LTYKNPNFTSTTTNSTQKSNDKQQKRLKRATFTSFSNINDIKTQPLPETDDEPMDGESQKAERATTERESIREREQ